MFVFQNPLPALKLAGAKMAGLHFIEKQKQIVFIAKFAQSDQVFRRRNCNSALALNRLDPKRRGRWRERAPHCVKVVERHVFDSHHRRLKTFFYFLLTSRSNPGQCPPMERFERRDDFETATVVAEFSRELEQTFVRLTPAVTEKE